MSDKQLLDLQEDRRLHALTGKFWGYEGTPVRGAPNPLETRPADVVRFEQTEEAGDHDGRQALEETMRLNALADELWGNDSKPESVPDILTADPALSGVREPEPEAPRISREALQTGSGLLNRGPERYAGTASTVDLLAQSQETAPPCEPDEPELAVNTSRTWLPAGSSLRRRPPRATTSRQRPDARSRTASGRSRR